MAKNLWLRIFLVAALALLAGVARPVSAQSPSASDPAPGSLYGTLTNLHSAPLAGVSIVLRNQATGSLMRNSTGRNGLFYFTGLEPGVYSIEAQSAELGRGTLQDIQISAGHQSRVQAAMDLLPPSNSEPVLALHFTPPLIPIDLVPESAVLAATLVTAPLFEQPFRDSYSLEPLPPTEPVALAAEVAPRPFESFAPPALSLPTPSPSPLIQAAASKSEPQALPPSQTQAAPQPAARNSETQLAALGSSALPNPLPNASAASAGSAVPAAASAVLLSAVQQAQQAPKAFTPAPAIQSADPASTALTTTVSSAQLESLPVSGRRWQEFVLDTPAASAQSGSSQPVLSGSAQNAPTTSIDGMSTQLAFGAAAGSPPSASHDASGESGNEQSVTPQGWNSGRNLSVSQAAIRQVETVAGDVETGEPNSGGGLVSVETRSGEEGYHGQAFLFDRQNTWGARNPFTQWVQNTGTATNPVFAAVSYTPPDHEEISGLGLGSRIRSNLPGLRGGLFWFAALDRYNRNDPGVATVQNPSNFFSALEPTSPAIQLLGAQLGESSTQAWSDYLGIPRAGLAPMGLEQLNSLLGPAARSSSRWVGFARLDWTAGERQHFTLEGTGSRSNSPGGGMSGVSETYGSHSFGSSEAAQQSIMLRWQSYLTANLLAVTQASFARSILSAQPGAPSAIEQQWLASKFSTAADRRGLELWFHHRQPIPFRLRQLP